MNVCAVIVTYGNRFVFLNEVVSTLCRFKEIKRIVVVDNNSAEESRKGLEKLRKSLAGRMSVKYLERNTGSANGYATGLEIACASSNCDFIWLLDDDNRPADNAITILKIFWKGIKRRDKEKSVCLVSYRENLSRYGEAVRRGKPDLDLGIPNVFRTFHVKEAPLLLVRKLLREKERAGDSPVREGLIAVAPYGGMFFHKALIDEIGYPDRRMCLYYDDHEFSYRITKNGGEIYLLLDSVIEDIDRSWHLVSRRPAFFRLAYDGNIPRLYYSVRNRVYFEMRELVTNRFVYTLNMLVYSSVVILLALCGLRFRNIRAYLCGLIDGINGRLGENPGYALEAEK
jgi:GT2 family glycosyltransferase